MITATYQKTTSVAALLLLFALGACLAVSSSIVQAGISLIVFGFLLATMALHHEFKFIKELVFLFPIYFALVGWPIKLIAGDLTVLWLIPILPLPFLIISALKHSDVFSPLTSVAKMWGLFLVFSLLSLFWSYAPSHGFTKLLILLTYGFIPGLYLMILCSKSKRFAWNIVLYIGIVYSLAIITFGSDSPEFPGRVSLPGANPIWCARATLFSAMVALFCRSTSPVLRFVTLSSCIYACVLTQSRGPVIAFAVSSLVGFFAIYKLSGLRNKIHRVLMVTIVSLAVGISVYSITPCPSGVINLGRLSTLLNEQNIRSDDNISSRVDAQKEAFETFLDNPILGAGIGSFSSLSSIEYPHFLPLEILCELGLLGLCFWVSAVYKTLLSVKSQPMLLAMFLQAVFFSLTSGDIGSNFEYMLVSLLVLSQSNKKYILGSTNISA